MNNVKFLQGDCIGIMERMIKANFNVDIVLTSPPYNTGRPFNSERARKENEARYDIHLDTMTSQEYRDWCVMLFDKFDKILNENGVVLWQVSYGNDASMNTDSIGLMWGVLSDIIDKTPFTIADRIVWKKKSAIPNNTSKNRLTRITEDIYVFCRKDEIKTFNANKEISSTSSRGQIYYKNIFNFIEAPNNDGKCDLNKATYSSDLCVQLLDIYANENSIVYDPFMGTGTTGIACAKLGLECYGSELSEAQVEYSKNRLREYYDSIKSE